MKRLHQIREKLTRPGSRFEIEQTEIRGVRTRTWKHAPKSLREVFMQSLDFCDCEYLIYEKDRLTYREHYDEVVKLSNLLMMQFAIRKGERIAIAMRNYPEYATIFWATLSIGAIIVPLNAWGSGVELHFALQDCDARILFADKQRLNALQPFLSSLSNCACVCVRHEYPQALSYRQLLVEAPSGNRLPVVDIEPDDEATILYTSGTTGRPKGAVGTHRNACSTIWTTLFCLSTNREIEGIAAPDPDQQKIALITTPMFHVIGCLSGLLVQTFIGAKVVLMYRWDADAALELIEQERVTSATTVPAMCWQLIEAQARLHKDVSSIERLSYGGAPAPAALFGRLEETFPGVLLMTGFGMTETSSPSTHSFGEYLRNSPTSAGLPSPVCDMKAVDENGVDLPAGQTGEIWIRGPNIVTGYWQRPDATAEAFDNGWVKSGDLGFVDEDGVVHIVDRLKDMVIRGGENIYCVEVENAIVSYGGIVEAAVIGLAHETLGEEVAVVIQLENGASVDEQSLREYLATELAAFKVPVIMEFRTTGLPRNATGKVLKSVLRRELSY